MMSVSAPQKIGIYDVATSTIVDAEFYRGVGAPDFLEAESLWGPYRTAAMKRLLGANTPPANLPQHSHWSWANKIGLLNLLAYTAFGIKVAGEWQGLMLTLTVGHTAKLETGRSKPIVYVDYLESAPWNVIPFCVQPKYKAIGARMLQAAVQQSVDEGFGGRVGLHALRDAVAFYTRSGMTDLGIDTSYHNLRYFEFTESSSLEFLAKR
jgi:hypothetical protein